jgi:ABC-type dipeptide/oligopeptide/nickel transport system ATPase component
MPSPSAPPAGRRFLTRCPEAFDRCRGEEPQGYAVADGAIRHDRECNPLSASGVK